MNAPTKHFTAMARLLHWLMALLLLAMLFIGVGMLSTLTEWHSRLLAIHKPLGLAILLLLVLRIVVRVRHAPPALPSDMSRLQRGVAVASHVLLYGLMLALPLLGWAMQGAAGYPLLIGGWLVPAIAPADPQLYALLRMAHGYLADLLFGLILLHLAAALYHGLIRRDGVLASMATGASKPD